MDKEKVTVFPASTTMTPEQALNSALQIPLTEVLIIGYDENHELVIRSSRMLRKDTLWLLEAAKLYAMEVWHGET